MNGIKILRLAAFTELTVFVLSKISDITLYTTYKSNGYVKSYVSLDDIFKFLRPLRDIEDSALLLTLAIFSALFLIKTKDNA